MLMEGFDKLFESTSERPLFYNGKFITRMDRINVLFNKITVKVCFEECNAEWRQGIILETKGVFYVNNQQLNHRIVLWYDTSPKNDILEITTKNKEILVYNVWHTGNGGIQYWHNGAAMIVDKLVKSKSEERKYYCNDGFPDDDFNDLIFTLEFSTGV